MRAYLMGEEPGCPLGYTYVKEPPFEAVVIGSLTVGQLLHFSGEQALSALAQGKQVLLYTPGLPQVKNRGLAATLASRQRELKSWGVVFTDGGRKKLITAEEARQLRQSGNALPGGAVLTPLAKEIWEGTK